MAIFILSACPQKQAGVNESFTITAQDANLIQGSKTTIKITVQRLDGINEPISLSIDKKIDGVGLEFMPKETAGIAILTFNAKADAPIKKYTLNITGRSKLGKVVKSPDFILNVVKAEVDPKVVSTSPKNNDTGIESDAKIVVEFNKPMKRSSVEQNFFSPDLGKNLKFAWSNSDKTLTVTPEKALEYSQDTKYRYYNFGINGQAEDAEGNQLGIVTEVKFSTFRTFKKKLFVDKEISGIIWSYKQVYTKTRGILMGDWSDDSYARGFMSFDLKKLGSKVLAITDARIYAYQDLIEGTPYKNLLGSEIGMQIYHVHYGNNLFAGDFDTKPLQPIRIFNDSPKLGWIIMDISSWVQEDFDKYYNNAKDSHSQLAFKFPDNTDNDQWIDIASFATDDKDSKKNSYLLITYYAP